MIRSFADRETEKIWNGEISRRFPRDIQRTARRKLMHIDAAHDIEDLRTPPGNRLHQLSGDRKKQHSISVNMQYRLCFRWTDGAAWEVELVDDHG